MRRLTGIARDMVGGVLAASGVTSPRRFGNNRLTVVTFHRVLPEEQRRRYPYPMLAVTPEELGWFLDFFRERFLCTTLGSAHRLFSLKAYPERPLLAITFDDAQLDNFEHARPVLESRGLRASFFVPVDAVQQGAALWHDRFGFALLGALGRDPRHVAELLDTSVEGPAAQVVERVVEEAKTWAPDDRAARVRGLEELSRGAIPSWAGMMSWQQVRALADAGHEIGSHSMSHAILPQLDEAAIEREVVDSRAAIEAAIDRPITSFCYPNGDCDDRVVRAVEQAGYGCAVTTRWGINERGTDRFRLLRCDMNPFYSTSQSGTLSRARVAWRMSGLHPGLR